MKLGFIGCGNMALAMIQGILSAKIVNFDDIMASDVSPNALCNAHDKLKIQTKETNNMVAEESDVVVLSIKPQFYEKVIQQIKEKITTKQLIITIAPGKQLNWLETQFGKQTAIVRAMPNTPATVRAGMTAVCPNACVLKEQLDFTMKLFCSFGKAEIVTEQLMDAVVSVSGSSPAYVFMLIEAMADAAVSDGMPRSQAYLFAAQAVLGSAKMVLEMNQHPAQLKDMVCSPGGTTIEAVKVLEQTGFRGSIFEAMKKCTQKSQSL